MSLGEIKQRNIDKVIDISLRMFVKNGIEKTKIVDIAKAANLTERSIFRYFPSKADLVLRTSLYYWSLVQASLSTFDEAFEDENITGYDLALLILKSYGKQFFEHPLQLIYVQEAETYLYRNNMIQLMVEPVGNYLTNHGYLSKALIKGLNDGSISSKVDLHKFYYNTYDGLLGLIQKMSITQHNVTDIDFQKSRIDDYCEMLVQTIKGD